jgi:predicted DNA-binding transcriptional regulator AlpA
VLIVTNTPDDIESPAAPTQRELAEKAMRLKAGAEPAPVKLRGGSRPGERPHAAQVQAAREQTAASLPALRHLQLLTRQEIMALTGLSYPTIWAWTQKGIFPRALKVGGKNMWRATEIDAWLAGLERRALKPIGGDAS